MRHLGKGSLILRRAATGHDLADRREGLSLAHAASARGEAGRMNRHDAEQRAQLPRAPVLQRTLRAASRAAAPAATVFLRLRLNEMTLQLGQQLLGLRLCQAQGFRRTGGQEAASDMHLVGLHTAVRAAQLHHYAPLHPSLTFHQPTDIPASCGDWSRARDRGRHRDNRRLVSTQLNRRLLAAGPEEGVPPRFWTVSSYGKREHAWNRRPFERLIDLKDDL